MIYLYLNNLEGGGVVKIHLNVMRGLGDTFEFRTVLNVMEGVYAQEIDGSNCHRPIVLNTGNVFKKVKLLLKLIETDGNPVFFVGNGQEAVVCSIVKLLASRTKVFYVQHVDLFLPQVGLSRNLIRTLLFLIPSLLADKLVVVSESLKRSITGKLPFLKNRILCIYNPVLPSEIPVFNDVESPYKFFQEEEKLNIVSVGRLSYQKGYDFLIAVAEDMAKKGLKNFRINIVGDGELNKHLMDLVKTKQLEEKFHFWGWQADPMKFIAHADLYILHSRWEGLPTVLIEAIAVAKRIVAHDCPHGVEEILQFGKLGDLVKKFDVHFFSDAIINSLNKEPRKINKFDFVDFTADRAYQNYSKHFSDLTLT